MWLNYAARKLQGKAKERASQGCLSSKPKRSKFQQKQSMLLASILSTSWLINRQAYFSNKREPTHPRNPSKHSHKLHQNFSKIHTLCNFQIQSSNQYQYKPIVLIISWNLI